MKFIGLRLKEYLEYKNVARKDFAHSTDIPYASLNHIINSNRNMSSDIMEKVFTYFPELNARWFITGKGPMEYTAASYHLDPVLEQSHDAIKEADEYIKNLPKEDIERLEAEGLKVKFDDNDYSKDLDDETIDSLLKEFIKKDEIRDFLREMIKENKK
ncbi:helix-turn-helix transcriptional regulator [Myroides odoratimimus]|uniref:helix-turn-helix domain-containing protein n=1 Tax=Myroides odoratimimus TaxID=76832 RepID=UPI002575CFEE|nr:helix-turn-helix transcriptional regulator [Myroides odoratimimus]MDM1441884.1 helix-turn-helix transcriptional regulator [Myroides odoratimimus]